MPNYLAIDPNDHIVIPLAEGVEAKFINGFKDLANYNPNMPVIFRGMTGRKVVEACQRQNREYLYIDTGYIGNMQKRKDWHRVVSSGMQHSEINWTLPNDRFEKIAETKPYLRFPGWKKHGESILVVTPSEKPCKFYGINRDKFVEETLATLKKYTDRPIIIRDKTVRRERVGGGSIYHQLDENKVFAVVTYNSIAATEAIGYGVPCFTLAPNAADYFCEKDLSKIESPLYREPMRVEKWQHWLAYCQYLPREMKDGTALKLIRSYGLK